MVPFTPSTPDFMRCETLRRYSLGSYVASLVEKPSLMGQRIAPGLKSPVEFIFAMVFTHKDGEVKLIVTSERTIDQRLLGSLGDAGVPTDNKAFLCAFDESGSHQNFGKFEGLDDANFFSRAALDLAAENFGIGEVAMQQAGVHSKDTSKLEHNLRDEAENEIAGPGDYATAFNDDVDQNAEMPRTLDLTEAVEEARCDGETEEAARLQERIDDARDASLLYAISKLVVVGTGNSLEDLRHEVEEARADGDIVAARGLQFAIDAVDGANVVAAFVSLMEQSSEKLRLLGRQIRAAGISGDTELASRMFEETLSIYKVACASEILPEDFHEQRIQEKMAALRSQIEEARADGDKANAKACQRMLDDLRKWLVAVRIHDSLIQMRTSS